MIYAIPVKEESYDLLTFLLNASPSKIGKKNKEDQYVLFDPDKPSKWRAVTEDDLYNEDGTESSIKNLVHVIM